MKRFLSLLWLAAAAAVILTTAGCSSAASPAQTPSPSAAGPTDFTQISGKTSSFPVSRDTSGTDIPAPPVTAAGESRSQAGSGAAAVSPHTAAIRSTARTAARSTQTPAAPPASTTKRPSSAAKDDGRITVTFSVDCSFAVAAGNDIAEAVSSDGIILRPTALVLEEGASVFDVLEKSGLVVVSGKGPFGIYIKSIQSLAEGACGRQSGWIYSVNGKYPGYSSSKYTLKDGDVVRWRYTCDGSENG